MIILSFITIATFSYGHHNYFVFVTFSNFFLIYRNTERKLYRHGKFILFHVERDSVAFIIEKSFRDAVLVHVIIK